MNDENKRQNLASRLIEREVYYCVSALISDLSALVQAAPRGTVDIDWDEDLYPLFEATDYEEAATQAINDCDDLNALESMVENVGYWDDACAQAGYDSAFEYADADGELDTIDFGTWFDEHCTDDEKQDVLKTLRTYVADHCSDWAEFCRENDVDTDDFHSEVYEHWIVSNWLAYKLKERGYVVGEVSGLTIYGRCCTGQSMCLDHNMQAIALELWGDEPEEEA